VSVSRSADISSDWPYVVRRQRVTGARFWGAPLILGCTSCDARAEAAWIRAGSLGQRTAPNQHECHLAAPARQPA